jgi:hypothetical protein
VEFVTSVNRRVVVSDRSAFLNGAIAHYLGVGLSVALPAPVRPVTVEVLGATALSDPRMARVQGERFAARHINHLEPAEGVLQIVTLTGCGTAPVEVDFLSRCGATVLSLARYDLDGSWESATMHADDAQPAFEMHPDGAILEEQYERVAELCRDAVIEIVSRLGGR